MTHTSAQASSILNPRRISYIDRHKSALGKSIRPVAIALALLPASAATAQQAPAIQWELVNPFRFIHDQKTVDELKTVYDGLTEKSAAALERQLQTQSEDAVTKRRDEAKSKYDCEHTTSPAEKRQCFEPYAGWFATLARNDHAKTCWDSKKHEFRKAAPCKDYIYPTLHKVRVWVMNPESLGDSVPEWIIQPTLTWKPCATKYGKLCIEFDVPYHADKPDEIRVTAQFPNLTLTTNPNIQVRDKLIVGLGDSFAAGEGNPDIPATFMNSDNKNGRDKDSLASRFTGHGTTLYPKRDQEAAWLDRRCHRSMYSYQFKTALQLALSKPQVAITYITFSCAGAVTPELIDKSQTANESFIDKLKPQLTALAEVLRPGTNPLRPIDYVLLSTGGNDIGFASYVAYILLGEHWLLRVAKGVSEGKIRKALAEGKIENTLWANEKGAGNYKKLQKKLMDLAVANSVHIEGCTSEGLCPRVVLTPYPNLLTNEKGESCLGDRLEFYDAFGVDNKRGDKISLVKTAILDPLIKFQAEPKITIELGWTVVHDNVNAYLNHGFCSQKPASNSIEEKFQIPTWLNEQWTQYDPRDYPAYKSRFRWFRSAMDSKLTADQHHDLGIFGELDLFFEDVTSNIMHPTAEGLSHTADLNVAEIKKIEAKGN